MLFPKVNVQLMAVMEIMTSVGAIHKSRLFRHPRGGVRRNIASESVYRDVAYCRNDVCSLRVRFDSYCRH